MMASKKTKRRKTSIKQYDIVLITTASLLLIIGFVAVLSASYPIGVKDFNNGYYYIRRHAFFMVMGAVLMFISANLKRDFLKKISPYLFLGSIFFVFLLWTPLAKTNYGQARWIKIPGIPFKIQPSDFVKITSVLYMAKVLDENKNRIASPDVFIKLIVIMGLSAGPILIKDFSTGVVIIAELGVMFLVGGMYFYQFVVLGGMGLAAAAALVLGVKYRRERVLSYFKGEHRKTNDELYQITQSLYAIAMGGFGGVGLFHSRQKYTNLPFAYNDFIFAIICEEFGAFGGIVLVILFAVFTFEGYLIASRAKDRFDKLVAVGLTTFIAIQAAFNIGVSIKLFPVTGITLPFISYGGTALLVSMTAVGLLLRISKKKVKEQGE